MYEQDRLEPRHPYDAVVIGAGNGGLTAAVSLALKGGRVLMLERHNVPGGCATSFCRGRFEFEVALHQLSGFGSPDKPGPLQGFLGKLGVLGQVEFVPMENLYRVVAPGDDFDLILPANRKEIISTLQTRFPEESEGVKGFFDLLYQFLREFYAIYQMRDPEASKEKYPLYFTYALKPSAEVLDQFFSDPRLKLALGVYWGYAGVPPSMLPFSDLAMLLYSYIEFKPYHIKGGSQALSNALAARFLELGGEIRFNCGARRILVEDDRITGVETEQGEVIPTACVISNASLIDTYIELIGAENTPPEQLDRMKGRTLGPSGLTVFVGLDCEASELGITETTNFICPSLDMESDFRAYREIDVKDHGVTLSCYNLMDPSFSPPGACQVALVTLKYADPWIALPPRQYVPAKFRAAEALLEQVEKVFPGFRGHIEEIEVATPLTHMRYLNHPGGAIYGFDQFARNSNLFVSPRSGIKGLFFAGAWVTAGGFEPTLMSGASAARAALGYLTESTVREVKSNG